MRVDAKGADMSAYLDAVGEASIRAARVKSKLSDARASWADVVAASGAFPSTLSVPLERNIHRIRAVCSRLEELEREALEEADRQAAIDQGRPGAPAGMEESAGACRRSPSGDAKDKR